MFSVHFCCFWHSSCNVFCCFRCSYCNFSSIFLLFLVQLLTYCNVLYFSVVFGTVAVMFLVVFGSFLLFWYSY